MALRELFAKFTFQWDRAALTRLETTVRGAEQRVRNFAGGFRRAETAARRGAAGAREGAGGVDDLSDSAERAQGVFARLRAGARGVASRFSNLGRSAAGARVGLSALGAVARAQRRVFETLIRTLSRVWSSLRNGLSAWYRSSRAARDHSRAVQDSGRSLSMWQRAGERVKASSSVMWGMLKAVFWIGLASAIMRATHSLARFAAQSAVTFGRRVFNLAAWTESLQTGLGMISGLGQRAGEFEFDRAVETARELGLEIESAVDGYKKLRGVGFSAAKALDLTKLTADMQAGLSLNEETTGRVLLALGQIKGAGRLQGDELRQLQETGLSIDAVWKSISEQLGVSVQKAMKLKEAGEVSADVAIKAVEQATLETLGTSELGEAAAALASKTMSGQLRQAKASAVKWLIDMGKALSPKFQSLMKTIGGTFAAFTKDGTLDRITHSIERLFGDFIDIIQIHWPRIQRILKRAGIGGADALDGITMSMDGMIDGFLSAVEWIQDHWPGIKETIVSSSKAIVGALIAIGSIKTLGGLWSVIKRLVGLGGAAAEATGQAGLLKAALGALITAKIIGGVGALGMKLAFVAGKAMLTAKLMKLATLTLTKTPAAGAAAAGTTTAAAAAPAAATAGAGATTAAVGTKAAAAGAGATVGAAAAALIGVAAAAWQSYKLWRENQDFDLFDARMLLSRLRRDLRDLPSIVDNIDLGPFGNLGAGFVDAITGGMAGAFVRFVAGGASLLVQGVEAIVQSSPARTAGRVGIEIVDAMTFGLASNAWRFLSGLWDTRASIVEALSNLSRAAASRAGQIGWATADALTFGVASNVGRIVAGLWAARDTILETLSALGVILQTYAGQIGIGLLDALTFGVASNGGKILAQLWSVHDSILETLASIGASAVEYAAKIGVGIADALTGGIAGNVKDLVVSLVGGKDKPAPGQPPKPTARPAAAPAPKPAAKLAPQVERIQQISRQHQTPTRPATVNRSSAVTLTDQRSTTITVPAAATPGKTGRAVAAAVARTQTADRKAIHAALVGAERG